MRPAVVWILPRPASCDQEPATDTGAAAPAAADDFSAIAARLAEIEREEHPAEAWMRAKLDQQD